MMKLRILQVVPVVAALYALGCGDAEMESKAPNPGSPGSIDRFEQVDMGVLPGSSFVPRSMGSRRETFIVKLAGDPVAVAQARAGTALRSAEKSALRDSLAVAQDAVAAQVVSLGGEVKARYRDAYNGLRIRIATSQLDALKRLPGVVAVYRPQLFAPNNTHGVPRIGAPGAWSSFAGVAGFHGEGVKIAIIDTGIDYTHADFGGAGTPEAFNAAFAASTEPADPAQFGPASPKVKGGIDLVGDDYNANQPETDVPVPDSNPLDCFGHGTHVAGTAAGFGVRADGSTYPGPYDQTTFDGQFDVGPGVAPLADLYAVRVFGCEGSTNVVVDALDWAVANDMDVVNMSLGSAFGSKDDPSAEASDNAVKAGVIVVASAGNSGPIDYITGSPASSSATISVAAQDPTPSFPGALAISGTTTIQTINANGAPLAGPYEVKILRDAAGNTSLGCSAADYVDVAGKIAVVKRGICARVARAVLGQQAGAAAVLMVNTANALPPFEGPITGNPDTGEAFRVTIPFLGARLADEAAVRALDGLTLSLSANEIANPNFNAVAGFSSLGPRLVDAHLKPDVVAPGLSIRSAGIGSGNSGAVLSGTSMAAPHTAGLAALVRQAHRGWSAAQIKTAIINTARPSEVVAYRTRRVGTGLVDAAAAVHTNVVAWSDPSQVHVNLGFLEQKTDYVKNQVLRIRNRGTSTVTFDLSVENQQGSPHTVTLSPTSVTVPPDNTLVVNATIAIDTATSGDSSAFRDVAGLVLFTPTGGSNSGVPLRVAYYGALRPQANVDTVIRPNLTPTWTEALARITNQGSEIAGTADFYAWGLEDANEQSGYVDLRAVGVQSFATETGRLVVFAVNTFRPWSTASLVETDVLIDSDLDGAPDFAVIGIDLGQLSTQPTFDGRIASAVLDIATGQVTVQFLASAPTNSSTMLLPVDASLIGISADNPRLSYSVNTFDLNSADTDTTGAAVFNAFASSVSQGDFVSVAPNATAFVPVTLDPAEQALSPARGHMVVTIDNHGGLREADLLPLR